MNGTLRLRAAGAAVAFAIAAAVFLALLATDVHQTVLMIPVAVAWAAALAGLRPMVPEERATSLYFAFAIMALMLFFVHETYEYTGKVRAFPLIIGYTGIALSVLDILSVTETRVGLIVTRIFGAALDEEKVTGPRLSRELLVFLALGAGVLAIWLFGFLIASPLFVFLWMLIGGRKPLMHALYGGIGTIAFIYLLFEQILAYELFPGVVTAWLVERFFY